VTNETPPAKTTAPAPAAAPASESKKADPVPQTRAEDTSFEPERECTYRIPYINKVIKVPCRD